MQNKEPERGVAALRRAQSDTVLSEKTRYDESFMFWIGISMNASLRRRLGRVNVLHWDYAVAARLWYNPLWNHGAHPSAHPIRNGVVKQNGSTNRKECRAP